MHSTVGCLTMMIVVIVALLWCVPIIQFIQAECSREKNNRWEYKFSYKLFEHPRKSVCFESCRVFEDIKDNRGYLANRGWVRQPHGAMIEEEQFKNMREKEYSIDLP